MTITQSCKRIECNQTSNLKYYQDKHGMEYIFVIHQHRHKTDGQILSLDSCPSSEYDIAKTINFSDVIDEFASVKARKITL
jgi:hypothetical protein